MKRSGLRLLSAHSSPIRRRVDGGPFRIVLGAVVFYRDYELSESRKAKHLIIKIFAPGSTVALPAFVLSSPPEARGRALDRARELIDKAIGNSGWKPDNDDIRS